MKKIEIILTDCIQEIKAGKATLAECLNRYPEKRQELEPLIRMALNIREPEQFRLDSEYKQIARASLLQQIRTGEQNRSGQSNRVRGYYIQSRFNRAKLAVSAITAIIVISVLTGGTIYAAQGSLPGDLIYPVKTGTEDIRLLLAGNSPAGAGLNLKYAEIRLEEMNRLAGVSGEKTEIAVQGYKHKLEAAGQQIDGIEDSSTRSHLLEQALEDLKDQTDYCDNVIDSSPRYIEQVREASTLSVNNRVQLLDMLAQDYITGAALLNFNAMQDRLQRAQIEASGRHYQSMQQALSQYQQFSQVAMQIMETARSAGNRDAEIIDSLTSQTLPGYLDIIDGISQEVPGEYRNYVEASRRMTLQLQTQAQHENQQNGSPGSGTGGQDSGGGNGPDTNQGGQGTPQSQDGNGSPGTGAPGTGDAPGPGPGGDSGGGSTGNGDGPAQGSGGNGSDNSGNGKTG